MSAPNYVGCAEARSASIANDALPSSAHPMGWASLRHLAGSRGLMIDGDWVESKDQDPAGDVRLVQLADIGVGSFLDRSSRFMTSDKATKLRCTYIEKGDILIARMPDPIGRACRFPGDNRPCVTVVDVCILRVDTITVDAGYVTHLLNSPDVKSQLDKFVKGTTRQRISRTNLEQIKIPLPALPEQRRIAAILDQADALRSKRREALAQLHALEDSIFSEFRNQTAKESRELLLIELSEKSRGSFVNGPFGSDLLTSELREEGVPVVYIRDIRGGAYQRISKVCVSEVKAKDLAVCSVKSGDVLVAKVGDPPGIAAVYPDSEPPAVVTQDVIRIRPNFEVALPEFIKAYLNSSVGRWKIAGITVEATRARFSLGDFKKLTVELPPLTLQNNLVSRIEAVKRLRAVHQTAIVELDVLFASLQHRAFRGEL